MWAAFREDQANIVCFLCNFAETRPCVYQSVRNNDKKKQKTAHLCWQTALADFIKDFFCFFHGDEWP